MSTRTVITAVTTALSAFLLVVPAPAQAAPCTQWAFNGYTVLNQSNGWQMIFNSTETRVNGTAKARAGNNLDNTMTGNVTGGIDRYAINLEVRWNSGPFGKYEGSVDANGFASGTTYDVVNRGSSAGWSAGQPLRCVTR